MIMRVDTDIDEFFFVADEQVAEDASLVQVAELDHILDALDRGGMHDLDASIGTEPVLL